MFELGHVCQLQIAELFQTTKQNVSKHIKAIKAIYEDQELDEQATVNQQLTVQKEGQREVSRSLSFYNLDVILAVGYRVRSVRGVQFRHYSSKVLKEYLKKGFALNDERLKNPGRIRDIRSSEKVMYRHVLDLYATASALRSAQGREPPVFQDRAKQTALCRSRTHR